MHSLRDALVRYGVPELVQHICINFSALDDDVLHCSSQVIRCYLMAFRPLRSFEQNWISFGEVGMEIALEMPVSSSRLGKTRISLMASAAWGIV
jgi:hypothetical protein